MLMVKELVINYVFSTLKAINLNIPRILSRAFINYTDDYYEDLRRLCVYGSRLNTLMLVELVLIDTFPGGRLHSPKPFTC